MSPSRTKDRQFAIQDFVLSVSHSVIPTWDESKYEGFLDELCQDREYQKDAIRTALRFLLGGQYENLEALAKSNYPESAALKTRWPVFSSFVSDLQFPEKLACTLDLATSTGKSYVIFGLAAIMMAENVVDRVLILCPSTTIERELTDKIVLLARNKNLIDLLPGDSQYKTPNVSDANSSILPGSICVENFHAILESVKSSIKDSLTDQGSRTLVLNDEVHHVFNASAKEVKKWKAFLLDPRYSFRYLVGLSGTCYTEDQYFANVVYRFSLRDAMEGGFVKRVEYVAESPKTNDDAETWQLVYKSHEAIKEKLRRKEIRPLTIIVTAGIESCKRVAEELIDWLTTWESQGVSEPDKAVLVASKAREKVLAVTSDASHIQNVLKLQSVDSSASPVEWIVSVSMLSEGWDVKNVFQIVPHEARAFDSKLLIAQVLGRGLRRPPHWSGSEPVVTVFNHTSWSSSIKRLVDEILELEARVSCAVDAVSPYHFQLEHLNYQRTPTTVAYKMQGAYNLFEAGYVDIPSQIENEKVSVGLRDALANDLSKLRHFKTTLSHRTFSANEIADEIHGRLAAVDMENESESISERTDYAVRYPRNAVLEIVRASLHRVNITSDQVTEANRQKFLQALGTLKRLSSSRVTYSRDAKSLVAMSTHNRDSDGVSFQELKHRVKSVFYTENSETQIPEDQGAFFRAVIDPDGEFNGQACFVPNSLFFKTPTNIVIADSEPERRFVRHLVDKDTACKVDAWLKNKAANYYSIEYSWTKGSHTKRGAFSPDFFIKIANSIFVIEIKQDDEIAAPSLENQKKYSSAIVHFDRLNKWLVDAAQSKQYFFHMLSPKDYPTFFEYLQTDKLPRYRSNLDVTMSGENQLRP